MRHAIAWTIAFVVMGLNGLCFAGEEVFGLWADKNTANIYSFDRKGDFEYYKKSANIGGRKSSAVEDEPLSYKVWKGVFSQGKDICSGLQKGDLMIYVDEMQCCLMAQEIAGKLVLTEVFSKGNEGISLCKDRVLIRIETAPPAEEE